MGPGDRRREGRERDACLCTGNMKELDLETALSLGYRDWEGAHACGEARRCLSIIQRHHHTEQVLPSVRV